MKKLLLPFLLLFFVVLPKTVVLAEEGSMSATASPTAAMVMTQYTLPYPGILPDNPLYILKTIRDNIVVFFISDPVKKSSFYLLQSDKRLEASWYLLKESQPKYDLALTTLSKSTNYFSKTVSQVDAAKKSGQNVNAQIDSLRDAITKHITTVKQMLALPGLANSKGFTSELQRLVDLEKVVSALRSS